MTTLSRLVRAIEMTPLPVIALVEGSVWGGACEVVITCDIAIAAPSATFAFTPAKLGVPYNAVGIMNMMKSVGMPLLKEMLFTARPIPVKRALDVGMINAVVPAQEIGAVARQTAAFIAETSPTCVALEGGAESPGRGTIREPGDIRAASRPAPAGLRQ